MHHLCKRIPFLGFVFLASFARGQEELKFLFDTTNQSYFKVSASYLTNAVYYGRKDSIVLPYITPLVGYYDKSGVYVESSLSYLISSSKQRIDLITIDGGYDFHDSADRFYGSLYLMKYFYNSQSTSVTSDVSAELGADFHYDFGPVTAIGGLDFLFSENVAPIFSGGLSYLSLFGKDDSWSVEPTVLANIGSNNFYTNYIIKRKFTRVKRPRAQAISVSITNSKSFAMLDYEFSAPFAYDSDKWGLFLTPSYSIPLNPVTYKLTTGANSVITTENLTNSFYVEFGLYLKFDLK